jgi:hypothetical protein
MDSIRPILQPKSHPIFTGAYLLNTNAINQLYEDVVKWIDNRMPGGIIYGNPRIGKTRAISFLSDLLKDTYGQELPIFTINMTMHKANENFFYSLVLEDIGHDLYDKGKSNDKKDRIISYFAERAISTNLKMIILFIDEANYLYEQDFIWLMDIHNRLERYGIRLTTLLVGTKDLIQLKSVFIKTKKQQIVGRFMIHEHRFSGVRSMNDLQMCLAGYDFGAEFPEYSGWTYTKYFFPEAYENGFTLSSEAETLFKCFHDIMLENQFHGEIEIPMQYVTLTIDICLRKYGSDGMQLSWISANEWRDSIRESGYVEAEGYNRILEGKQ